MAAYGKGGDDPSRLFAFPLIAGDNCAKSDRQSINLPNRDTCPHLVAMADVHLNFDGLRQKTNRQLYFHSTIIDVIIVYSCSSLWDTIRPTCTWPHPTRVNLARTNTNSATSPKHCIILQMIELVPTFQYSIYMFLIYRYLLHSLLLEHRSAYVCFTYSFLKNKELSIHLLKTQRLMIKAQHNIRSHDNRFL